MRRVVYAIGALHRESIQHLVQRCNRVRAQSSIRHEGYCCCLWRNQTQPLIRNKEECLVFTVVQARNSDWSAQCAAEIVLPKGRFRLTKVIVEPVLGINRPITQVVVCRAMPLIGA